MLSGKGVEFKPKTELNAIQEDDEEEAENDNAEEEKANNLDNVLDVVA